MKVTIACLIMTYIFFMNCSCKIIHYHTNKDVYNLGGETKNMIVTDKNVQLQEHVTTDTDSSSSQSNEVTDYTLRRENSKKKNIRKKKQKLNEANVKYTAKILNFLREKDNSIPEKLKTILSKRQRNNVFHDKATNSYENLRYMPEIMALTYPDEQKIIKKYQEELKKPIRPSKKEMGQIIKAVVRKLKNGNEMTKAQKQNDFFPITEKQQLKENNKQSQEISSEYYNIYQKEPVSMPQAKNIYKNFDSKQSEDELNFKTLTKLELAEQRFMKRQKKKKLNMEHLSTTTKLELVSDTGNEMQITFENGTDEYSMEKKIHNKGIPLDGKENSGLEVENQMIYSDFKDKSFGAERKHLSKPFDSEDKILQEYNESERKNAEDERAQRESGDSKNNQLEDKRALRELEDSTDTSSEEKTVLLSEFDDEKNNTLEEAKYGTKNYYDESELLEPPTDVAASEVTSTSANVSWTLSDRPGHKYCVILYKPTYLNQSYSEISGVRDGYFIFRYLSPNTEYEMFVIAVGKKSRGPRSEPLLFTTEEAVPSEEHVTTEGNWPWYEDIAAEQRERMDLPYPNGPGDSLYQAARPEDSPYQAARPEDSLYQAARPEDSLYQAAHPEDSLYQAARPEDSLYQAARPEDSLYQTARPEDSLYQAAHPEDSLYRAARPEDSLYRAAPLNSSIEVDGEHHQANITSEEIHVRAHVSDKETLGNYAFSASIQRMGTHYANGALLALNWVISSAAEFYNVRETIRLFQVRVGSVSCKKNGLTSHIQSIAIHHHFLQGLPSYDISLLKTASPFVESLVVKPIQLSNVTSNIVDAKFLTTYWPKLVVKDRPIPLTAAERVLRHNMRVSTQKLVPSERCQSQLTAANTMLDGNSLCLRPITVHHSACMPDAGAPVVAENVLWGITSGWVSPLCPYVVLPTIFTRISGVRSWIDDQMNS